MAPDTRKAELESELAHAKAACDRALGEVEKYCHGLEKSGRKPPRRPHATERALTVACDKYRDIKMQLLDLQQYGV